MSVIEKQSFGRTGHMSTRAIFGSFCLSQTGQDTADKALEILLEYGINHIDTAPAYGDAELRLGPWMKQYRAQFFLATKTDKRTYQEAREQFYRSLERLQVDRVDLLQMHNLTDVVHREIVMRSGGALEFLIEARDKGLARFIGITGHGILAPKMHLQSLERFDFDSVLLPCNYPLMQLPRYRDDFNQVLSYCREHNIAVQITWYEPLNEEEAVKKSVHWVMNQKDTFLITTGDLQVLPKFLAAAADFQKAPPDDVMAAMVAEQGMQPLFDQL